jgi:hypothetical protein
MPVSNDGCRFEIAEVCILVEMGAKTPTALLYIWNKIAASGTGELGSFSGFHAGRGHARSHGLHFRSPRALTSALISPVLLCYPFPP